MSAYYNEFDPKAAAWLRELIKQGHIADGVVDERSIIDVTPDELRGFTQCHFFAGIGVWSYALRQAGWSDDRRVWTGSCPCQPFSTAGKGAGFTDERHLWPSFYHLISQCRPDIILGEQVASKDGLGWLDLVQADLETTGYAFGAVDLCAAGVGAPHIRQRLWFVGVGNTISCGRQFVQNVARSNAKGMGSSGWKPFELGQAGGSSKRLADDRYAGPQGWLHGRQNEGWEDQHGHVGRSGATGKSSPNNGFWRDADWLFCRDGKWRPVEPSTFPLAHGSPARVGRLRGYGNAIVAQAAQAVIESVM